MDTGLVTYGLNADVSVSFTRPADTTQYASGDLVANSATAAAVVPMQFEIARAIDASFTLLRVRIKKTNTGTTSASFRLHLYKNAPTPSNGDNGAWLTTESTYLGSCDVTMDKAYTDFAKGIGVPNEGTCINGLPSTGTKNIYGLLEARGTYTPASAEVFTVTLEVFQN